MEVLQACFLIVVAFAVFSSGMSAEQIRGSTLITERSVYSFFKVQTTYPIAEAICSMDSAKLVDIKTKQVQNILFSELWRLVEHFGKKRKFSYWIGGRRADSNHTWLWSDGSPIPTVNSSDFNYSQTNAFQNVNVGSNCLGLTPRDVRNFDFDQNTAKWKTYPCSDKHFFICQKDYQHNPTMMSENLPSTATEKTEAKTNKSYMYGILALFAVLLIAAALIAVFLWKRLKITKVQLSLSRESILPERAYPNNLYEVPISPSAPSPLHEGDMAAAKEDATDFSVEYERQGLPLPTPASMDDYRLQAGFVRYEIQRPRNESTMYMEIKEKPGTSTEHVRLGQSCKTPAKNSPYLDMKPSLTKKKTMTIN